MKSKQKVRSNSKSFPIVGIGASAGGLEAVTALLKHLPADTHMAFVLVQHRDPTHESALSSLLARATKMNVREARHNMLLAPNSFYVIPPNKDIRVEKRRLKVLPRGDQDGHLPIEEFFKALAAEEGGRAIGVILSGNGADGTQGCQAIKSSGGISMAQDEKSAKIEDITETKRK